MWLQEAESHLPPLGPGVEQRTDLPSMPRFPGCHFFFPKDVSDMMAAWQTTAVFLQDSLWNLLQLPEHAMHLQHILPTYTPMHCRLYNHAEPVFYHKRLHGTLSDRLCLSTQAMCSLIFGRFWNITHFCHPAVSSHGTDRASPGVRAVSGGQPAGSTEGKSYSHAADGHPVKPCARGAGRCLRYEAEGRDRLPEPRRDRYPRSARYQRSAAPFPAAQQPLAAPGALGVGDAQGAEGSVLRSAPQRRQRDVLRKRGVTDCAAASEFSL